MKLFQCQYCGQLLYFENVRCERCGHALGYLSERVDVTALVPQGNSVWRALADGKNYRYCANALYEACNWLIPANEGYTLCRACILNHTIPNLSQPEHRLHWQKLESAKHLLVYGLICLGLPVRSKGADAQRGLAFDFLVPDDSPEPVITGHADGLITINVAEADDAERERMRLAMGEPYRTLLGHFRHEVGHYYWNLLALDSAWLADFRACFGDDREDYAVALQRHYAQPAAPDWMEHYVSAYAAAHPWEDWAETWTHYLHVVDTLETAYAFGLQLHPQVAANALAVAVDFDAYGQDNFDKLIAAWFPVTHVVNSLNRSMGQPDLYPFVLSPEALKKMEFVHSSIRSLTKRLGEYRLG